MQQKLNPVLSTIVIAIALAITTQLALAQGHPGYFLRIIDSPRANGMGGTALGLIDANSAIYNPAAMALYYSKYQFSVTDPIRNDYLPAYTNGLSTANFSAGGRIPGLSLLGGNLSAAYTYRRFTLGQIELRDVIGNAYETLEPLNRSHGVTVGFARGGAVNFGFGVSLKFLKFRSILFDFSELRTIEATSTELDVSAMIEGSFTPARALSPRARTEIRYRVAFLATPYSADVKFVPQQPEPSFRVLQYTAGLSAEFGDPRLRPITVMLNAERDHDITGGGSNMETVNRGGVEIGACETMFFRAGAIDDGRADGALLTYGAGFSLAGLLKFIRRNRLDEFLIKRFGLDVRFDYSRYESDPTRGFSESEFYGLSIAWAG